LPQPPGTATPTAAAPRPPIENQFSDSETSTYNNERRPQNRTNQPPSSSHHHHRQSNGSLGNPNRIKLPVNDEEAEQWSDNANSRSRKQQQPPPVSKNNNRDHLVATDNEGIYSDGENNGPKSTTTSTTTRSHTQMGQARVSNLASSPSGTFGTNNFQPLAYSAAASAQINKSMPLSGTSGIKPEKMWSPEQLNKKLASSTKNVSNLIEGGGSDGSLSGKSEFQKGANVVSSLTSDPNRITTVSTNANNTTTTTTTVVKDPATATTTPTSTANKAVTATLEKNDMDLFAPSSSTNPPPVVQQYTTPSSKREVKEPLSAIEQQAQLLLEQQRGGIWLQAIKPKPKVEPAVAGGATDGTVSDSALTNPQGEAAAAGGGGAGGKKRRPSMAKALVILGLSKKSNSANNLTLGKRIGFARVSEEYGVTPELRNRNLSPPGSVDSGGEDKPPKYVVNFV
jgi:hypothetical protein